MKTKLFILAIVLSSLACGMETAQVNSTSGFYVGTHPEAEERITVNMTVTAYQLNVRDGANGEVVEGFYLIQNDTVTVYAERTVGDIEWCRITPIENEPRWVACGWLIAEAE